MICHQPTKAKKGGRTRKRIKPFHRRNCRKETIVGQSESLKHKKQNDQTFRKMRYLKISKSQNFLREAIVQESAVFNIVQKAFDPPPPHSFENYVVNFSEGILTKVRKCLSLQLLTK